MKRDQKKKAAVKGKELRRKLSTPLGEGGKSVPQGARHNKLEFEKWRKVQGGSAGVGRPPVAPFVVNPTVLTSAATKPPENGTGTVFGYFAFPTGFFAQFLPGYGLL